jgi:hypothetical protein
MYFLLLALVGTWLMAEGAMAILYVYPPPFWVLIRIVRILIGGGILLEARRVRVKYHFDEKEKKGLWKLKQGYIDLLTLVGVWTAVDGIGTGFLGYVYPIVTWQIVRLMRIVVGASLIIGGHYFISKLQLC